MPVPLRADFDAVVVRALAKKSKDGAQARRLLAVAAIYAGASRTEAAKIAGVTLQIIRDWVVKFNASGPERLIDRKAPGRAALLSEKHRKALDLMTRGAEDERPLVDIESRSSNLRPLLILTSAA